MGDRGDWHSQRALALSSVGVVMEDIQADPYNYSHHSSLSKLLAELGYPDLAASEAYLSLLLCDEAYDDSAEYHAESLECAGQAYWSSRGYHSSEWGQQERPDGHVPEDVVCAVHEYIREYWEPSAYESLVSNLILCGDLRSASEFCTRALSKLPLEVKFAHLQAKIESQARERLKKSDEDHITLEEYPRRSLVRRELYPWNDHEPDRFSEATLTVLNKELEKVAPRLEIKVTELPDLRDGFAGMKTKQLGIFAREDLLPGEIVLHETSLLTASGRLLDSFCDACTATLSLSMESCVPCPDCQDTIFCSPECLTLAQETYHPALCDTDTSAIAKDAPAAEASDALYSLLLLRVFAMSETQGIHPLDLPEVKNIWGDYSARLGLASRSADGFDGEQRLLPFNFHTNVLLPLHMLEKLNVDVFRHQHRYAAWITNTLYAKFRGTASARQGPNALPAVAAVHPLWCIANHSCDPNVAWDWHGRIVFRVRESRVVWAGKDAGLHRAPGVRKGEEVFSHYCDVGMPAAERREWAAGALGGTCCCERCLWETGEEPRRKDLVES